jgi:hypothetical protein
MDDPIGAFSPVPEPTPVRPDRLAVAIGNASLLGVGYLLLGRRAWAVVTGLVTLVFLVLLGAAVVRDQLRMVIEPSDSDIRDAFVPVFTS